MAEIRWIADYQCYNHYPPHKYSRINTSQNRPAPCDFRAYMCKSVNLGPDPDSFSSYTCRRMNYPEVQAKVNIYLLLYYFNLPFRIFSLYFSSD